MYKIKIVIVDDNKEFTYILNEFLNLYRMEGVEIAGTAENGLKALELILALEPDVVILDIVMPKLNGIDVLKRVHDSDMKKRPRFIVLSAMDQDDLTQQALELGAECYITKPFDMEALVDRIIKGSFAQT